MKIEPNRFSRLTPIILSIYPVSKRSSKFNRPCYVSASSDIQRKEHRDKHHIEHLAVYQSPLSSNRTRGTLAEYDLFWKGTVIRYLSDVNPSFDGPRVDQGTRDGYGARVCLQLTKQLHHDSAASLEIFFRYRDIDRFDESILTGHRYDRR